LKIKLGVKSLVTKILEIFKKISKLKVAITFHENGDPDAVGSAIALYEILKNKYRCKVNIIFESISKISKRLLDHLKLDLKKYTDFKNNSDFLFFVDTNNPVQIGSVVKDIVNYKNKIIIIDHHPKHKDVDEFSYNNFIDPTYSSTCEIIFDISKIIKYNFTNKTKFLLLAGITYDSRHFIIANKRSFESAYQLIDKNINYSDIISLLNQPKDRSEKIARLKSSKRIKLYEIDDKWLLIFSSVSSYEASASRALIDLGADIAIVSNIEKDQIRVSARSSIEFYEQTKFHLGKDLMEKIGPIIKGQGGGHDTAAGCNGTENGPKIINNILEILKNKISKNLKKIELN
jgi:phosphoesterase RecJ-like protein